MKKYFDQIKNILSQVDEEIYVGEKLRKNLKAITIAGLAITFITIIMTLLNIYQHLYYMAISTLLFALTGLACAISAGKFKNRVFVKYLIWILCAVIMTIYAIKGSNGGFAILWTILLPAFYTYFLDVSLGISLSCYFELLFCILFYSPIRQNMVGLYTDFFLNRYPILYALFVILNAIQMITYHTNSLENTKHEENLKAAVENERKRVMEVEWERKKVDIENKSKTDFIESIGYSVRTPITSIVALNDLILKDSKDTTIREYANDIHKSCNELLSVIDGVMAITGDTGETGDKQFSNATISDYSILETDLSNLSILVVDDNDINRKVLKKYLSLTKCLVDVAKDGEEAIFMTENKLYDAILMDHIMPDVDGIMAMKRIRESKTNRNRETKIIAVTANTLGDMKARFIQSGFDDYIAKPINFNYLISVLQQIHGTSVTKQEEVIIDVALGLENCINDREMFYEIVEEFAEQTEENITELKRFLVEEDYEKYKVLVHALKNNAHTIGSLSFSEHSKSHEYAVRDKQFNYIADDFDSYVEEYRKVAKKAYEMIQ